MVQIRTKVLLCCLEGFPIFSLTSAFGPTWMKGSEQAVMPSVGLAQEGGQGGKEVCSRQGLTRKSRVHWWFKELVSTVCSETACTHSSACNSLVSAAVKLSLFGFSCRTNLPKVLQQQNTVKFRCFYSVASLRKDHIEKSAYSCSRYHY